jgi:hypothetical protein
MIEQHYGQPTPELVINELTYILADDKFGAGTRSDLNANYIEQID